MKWKTAICGALVAGLLLAPTYAADFSDTEDHWAKESIDRWSAHGVICGYENGAFGPNDPITRGGMAVILSRMFGWQDKAENTFHDLTGSEWYAEGILQARAAGVMAGDGNGNARPGDVITRQEAAVMLSRALRISNGDSGNTFGDSAKIGSWAASAVNGMSRSGYITGSTDGNFYPQNSITRAETVTILNRAITNYYDKAGSYSDAAPGITVIAAPGVTLQGMTVEGDLLIAPGANGSEVVLKDVAVTGKTYIQTGPGAKVTVSDSRFAQIQVEGAGACVTFQDKNTLADLLVSGDGSVLRGLPEQAQVTVTEGTAGVVVNGHPAEPGTISAGKDISNDEDDSENVIEFDIVIDDDTDTGSGGSGSGAPAHSTPSPSPTPAPTPTPTPEPSQPPKSDVDENGNIVIDFGDLLKP